MGQGAAGIAQAVKPPQRVRQRLAALPEIPHPLGGLEEVREERRVDAGCPPASAHPECAATCC